MTEWCKAHITALAVLALPDLTSNSSSCISSLVNAILKYLNFATCFNDTPPTCNKRWAGFLEKLSTSVLEVLMFIPSLLLAATKPLKVCGGEIWRKPA